MSKTSVIIKGNPKLVENNKSAEAFYLELKLFLESLSYEVLLDLGEPYTTPPTADLWIGHSRGSDRLRFAPEGTIIIGLGVPTSVEGNNFAVVNHPRDELAHRVYEGGKIIKGEDTGHLDDTYHYVLTEDMKKEIVEIIEKEKSVAGRIDPTTP